MVGLDERRLGTLQVPTRGSALATLQVVVASAVSHTHALSVSALTKFDTHTTKPPRLEGET
jgi:hypothetical protein